MMTRNEIREKTIQIIKENLPEFKNRDLQDQTKINTAQGLDSRTFIYVRCKIESFFDIHIPEKKWAKRQTLADRVSTIENDLRKKA